MARRIYLHIGVMKSATSYLQALCEENRERLATAGIYWCPDVVRYPAVRDLLGKTRADANEANGWDRVVQDLRRHSGDALLSNELLAGLGPRQVSRLVQALPEADVRVVITARDLARIIPSHWQTTIKNGRTWTWPAFAAAVCADEPTEDQAETNGWFWRRHDLPSIVARWAQEVPVERITLVTVPSDSSDLETVAARFGSVVGIAVAGLERPQTQGNPTLGAHSVELLRRLNGSMAQTELDDPDHRYERALGGALSVHASLEPRFGLTPGQQDWVRRRALVMVEQVGLLGLQVVGDLADLVPAESPVPDLVDPGDTTDSELLAAAARGLASLAPVFNDLRAERDELRCSLTSAESKSPRSLLHRARSRRGRPEDEPG